MRIEEPQLVVERDELLIDFRVRPRLEKQPFLRKDEADLLKQGEADGGPASADFSRAAPGACRSLQGQVNTGVKDAASMACQCVVERHRRPPPTRTCVQQDHGFWQRRRRRAQFLGGNSQDPFAGNGQAVIVRRAAKTEVGMPGTDDAAQQPQ